MKIIKSDGSKVDYDPGKIRVSLKRTGADRKLIDQVLSKVAKRVEEGMTTRELYNIVHEELRKGDRCVACKYDLRGALFRLGPAGFRFEHYVASILRAYDYEAEVPKDEIKGVCVSHEVDVVAKKDGRNMFIEAKFRNDIKGYVDLKDTMATWSRFLDLVDASKTGKGIHFDEAWIITNAQFSDRARQFGVCKGIHLIGWNFPEDYNFANMVDHSAVYPVTVLDGIKEVELDAFADNDILLCREIAEKEPKELSSLIGMPIARAKEVVGLCTEIIAGESNKKKLKK